MSCGVAWMTNSRIVLAAGLFVATLTLAIGCRETPPAQDNILEHFKYGVLGTEVTVGVP